MGGDDFKDFEFQGSGRDATGLGLKIVEDSVAAAACGFDVFRLEGAAVTSRAPCGGAKSEVEPPGAVVEPEVVVRVGIGVADGEVVGGLCRRHSSSVWQFLLSHGSVGGWGGWQRANRGGMPQIIG